MRRKPGNGYNANFRIAAGERPVFQNTLLNRPCYLLVLMSQGVSASWRMKYFALSGRLYTKTIVQRLQSLDGFKIKIRTIIKLPLPKI